jgi:AraC-like DNA-binding protein
LLKFTNAAQVLVLRLSCHQFNSVSAVSAFLDDLPAPPSASERVILRALILSLLAELQKRLPVRASLTDEFLNILSDRDEKTAVGVVLTYVAEQLGEAKSRIGIAGILDARLSESTFGLRDLADELHLSYAYTSSLVRMRTGLSFRHMLTARRLEMARDVLATTRLSIKEVAARVGFAGSAQLDRNFRKRFGIAPSAYRKRCAGDEL